MQFAGGSLVGWSRGRVSGWSGGRVSGVRAMSTVSDDREGRAEQFAERFRAVYLTFHRRDGPRGQLQGASRAVLEHHNHANTYHNHLTSRRYHPTGHHQRTKESSYDDRASV
jgi:hypothetical protein